MKLLKPCFSLLLFLVIFRCYCQLPNGIQFFSVKQLLSTHGNQEWNEFLDADNMRAGIYQVKKGKVMELKEQDNDGAYYILHGKGVAAINDRDSVVNEGGVLFVQAGNKIYFRE